MITLAAARSLEFLSLFILLLLTKHATAQLPTRPTYFQDGCYDYTGNYSDSSAYHNNLKLVLSDLVSNASAGLTFYSTSVGALNTDAAVYGLYYCRGDIAPQLCSECVNAAVQNASSGGACFPIKEGVIWYEECTLQYSNVSMLGVLGNMDDLPRSYWNSTENVSDPNAFLKVLSSNMKSIIHTAAYENGSRGFATGKEDATQIETLYSLVQCRPDINSSFCDSCLSYAFTYINSCCRYSADWVYVFLPSCQLRYSLSPFYFTATTPPPPPPPSGPAPSSPPPSHHPTGIAIPIAAVLFLLLLCGGGWFCWRKRKNEVTNPSQVPIDPVPTKRVEEPDIGNVECFDFREMESATVNFSDVNKLGQGGFGSVYKGILPNGQLVAVKRLSRSAVDRIREFKTEVAVVAKLQHRNLVRLLGFSADREERILVYEFLPNLSLDQFLFDTTKSINLDWRTRLKIIEGIAWGLRYLHVDSLLTIVHRDLKSSNILLDKEMNPKIADFGLAKLVTINESTVNVTTIAGTMGYMAPEYVMAGRCTVKSDIYSFGVIILEIVSGKSIGKFYDPISQDGLLHYAWGLWNQRAIEGLMDPTLQNKYSRIEAERCVQIALLCVEDNENKRPTIRVLLSMLENHSYELPHPTPSTFYRSNRPPAMSMTMVSPGEQTQSSQTEDQYELSTSNVFHKDLYPR